MTPHAESYRAGRFHRTVGRQERDPGVARRNLLEQLQPLARYCSLHANETGDVAARPRQASDEAIADRISNLRENDRDGVRLLQQRPGCWRVLRKNEIRLQPDELLCKSLHQLNIGRRPAIVASDGTVLRPAEFLESLAERCDPGASFPVALGIRHQHAHPPHTLALLRACRERPRRRRPTEKHDERAAPHSITSSARASSVGGMVRPSALAVLRLMTSSNLVGC